MCDSDLLQAVYRLYFKTLYIMRGLVLFILFDWAVTAQLPPAPPPPTVDAGLCVLLLDALPCVFDPVNGRAGCTFL